MNSIAKFLHNSYGKKDITDSVNCCDCSQKDLFDSLLFIRKSIPDSSLKHRIQRIISKMTQDDSIMSDIANSECEEFSSQDELPDLNII